MNHVPTPSDTPPPAPAQDRVLIFDTTLRDGEQSPGASMNLPEKLEIARTLENLGVDIIEAGFPIASPDDFAAVSAISGQTTRARICALARALPDDIGRAAEAVRAAGTRGRIHIFLATSAIHRQFKLNKAKDQIIHQACQSIALARTMVDDVEFSPEDASRTEPEFLAEVVQAAINAGASTINIPDTVGYAYPNDYADLITYLRTHVTNITQAVISVHCHNDLGLAVANSLAAVRAGARQVECTINGIGERAGNCSLEEVVMAMRVRKDIFPTITTNIVSNHLYGASRMVQSITGLSVQRNKAVVGDNAFAHESGIHQHGMLKNAACYEIMTPQSVGVPDTSMVLGKHSGRAALASRLGKLGIAVKDEDLGKLFEAFKVLADRKKEIYDGDMIALVEEVVRGATRSEWVLQYLHSSSTSGHGAGSGAMATATVRLQRGDETITDAATGDGPVDAVICAFNRITGMHSTVEDYRLRAVTKGGDALGEVSMRVRLKPSNSPGNGTVVGGKGLSTDIVHASALAYLDAINRMGGLVGRLDYQASPPEAMHQVVVP